MFSFLKAIVYGKSKTYVLGAIEEGIAARAYEAVVFLDLDRKLISAERGRLDLTGLE